MLTVGRALPGWLCRAAALAAALASASALWRPLHALQTPEVLGRVEILWEPLNFFRAGPTLRPDGLGLTIGLLLAGYTAAAVLGIRGAAPVKSAWHGLLLVALAAGLIMAMAANLLTLALGSGLIDLVLVALAITWSQAGGDARRPAWPWAAALPGLASTLVLVAAAVWMDARAGTTSLLARQVPAEIVTLLGVAGLLRLLVVPLPPRSLKLPEQLATLVLPIGSGFYLLARAQALGSGLAGRPWIWVAAGIALLAGGSILWAETARSRASGPVEPGGPWAGVAVHQAGLALTCLLLPAAALVWPLLGLAGALGLGALWWDGHLERPASAPPAWLDRIGRWLSPGWARAQALTIERLPFLTRLKGRQLAARVLDLLPILALGSLAGVPFTVGALARWQEYGGLLGERRPGLLLALLAADTLLIAGLWSLRRALRVPRSEPATARRPSPGTLLAMLALAVVLLTAGLAPGRMAAALGARPAADPGVSAWGLGLLYVLPWLLGSWLARVTGQALDGRAVAALRRLAVAEHLARAATWSGRQLVGAVYWVGRAGEGEGWWGWALIILAIGTLFLAAR